MKQLLFTCCAILALMACQTKERAADFPLPKSPDYSDTTQWYISDRHSEADVFYIISTETGDYTLDDGFTYHHADTYNDSVRGPMYAEMLGVDTLLSGKLNYFAPYYRQCSLQSFMNDSIAQQRFPIALGDAREAFDYYLKHLNNGRPFILAGFSQGATIMLQLLQVMDEDTYQRMIAAYAIGVSVPQEMVDKFPHIVPVKGADDVGVTICYNSVKDASSALHGKSAIAINPANWKTDATPVTWMTEPTPWLPVSEQKKDTLTAHLDVASGLVFVDGYTATDYVLPLIGKEGNYHTREIWLYRQQLKDNMALRAERFLKLQRSSH